MEFFGKKGFASARRRLSIFLRWRLARKASRKRARASTATPPTAPPAMAPTEVFADGVEVDDSVGVGADLVVDDEAVAEIVLLVGLVVELDVALPVDVVLVVDVVVVEGDEKMAQMLPDDAQPLKLEVVHST